MRKREKLLADAKLKEDRTIEVGKKIIVAKITREKKVDIMRCKGNLKRSRIYIEEEFTFEKRRTQIKMSDVPEKKVIWGCRKVTAKDEQCR